MWSSYQLNVVENKVQNQLNKVWVLGFAKKQDHFL